MSLSDLVSSVCMPRSGIALSEILIPLQIHFSRKFSVVSGGMISRKRQGASWFSQVTTFLLNISQGFIFTSLLRFPF